AAGGGLGDRGVRCSGGATAAGRARGERRRRGGTVCRARGARRAARASRDAGRNRAAVGARAASAGARAAEQERSGTHRGARGRAHQRRRRGRSRADLGAGPDAEPRGPRGAPRRAGAGEPRGSQGRCEHRCRGGKPASARCVAGPSRGGSGSRGATHHCVGAAELAMAGLLPTAQVLAILASLVEERVGLHYPHAQRELLADKLVARAQEAGFVSLLDYYYFLRYDDPQQRELERLVEALLVHETYLFRELHSLEVAVDHAVVPVVESGRRARIWSAACATGEEAVSLAVLLAERGVLDRCELVASDISEEAVARARAGRYRARSLRRDGLALAERWLAREGDETVVP